MGGGKGGSDFYPKGKSDNEVMSFCQSFLSELQRRMGPNTDVPAGDIGVEAREIGYLFGQYKKIRNEFTGVLTGKSFSFGGSLLRPEATGYGLVYFTAEMLNTRGETFRGKIVTVSGSGNVAQFASEKVVQLGGKVVTLSDSQGTMYDHGGLNQEKIEYVKWLKNVKRGRISEYVEQYPDAEFFEGKRPWFVKCDVALPCATQNEISKEDAEMLINNGCHAVAEGANMPSEPEAIDEFHKNKILFGPGKASNAGGVAVSGLEMSQNSLYQPGHERAWTSASMTSWKVYTTLLSNTARPKMEVTSITSREQILEASSKLFNQCLNKELFGELFCIDLRFNVRTSSYRRTKNFYNIKCSKSSTLITPEISDSVWKVSST